MSRSMPLDNTNIYRYKYTTTGVHAKDGWGHKAGEAFETIEVAGPYSTRVTLTHWRPKGATLKVEQQQLAVNIERPTEPILEWVTLKTMILEDETDG